jgi:cysteine sulfinate desulfinase/cysteine desulfurase-like protein
VTLGTYTTPSEIERFVNILPKVVSKLRKLR